MAILAFVTMGYVVEDLFESFGVLPWVFPIAAFATLASIWLALSTRRDVLTFTMSGMTILFATVTVFLALFTRGEVLPSTRDPRFSLSSTSLPASPTPSV